MRKGGTEKQPMKIARISNGVFKRTIKQKEKPDKSFGYKKLMRIIIKKR